MCSLTSPLAVTAGRSEPCSLHRELNNRAAPLRALPPVWGKLLNRATGWASLSLGAHVAYQTDLHGPASRELTVGRVLAHDRPLKEQRLVVVQPMRGQWKGARVTHELLRQSWKGYSVDPIAGDPARETVRYEALVFEVKLLKRG